MPLPRAVARFNRYVTNPLVSLFAGFMPGFGMLHHVGRKSGRAYTIPVNVFRRDDTVIIGLTYGSGSDWVKNVLAAGGCELETRGKTIRLIDPVLEVDSQKDWAPLPIRIGLRLISAHEVLRFHVAVPH